MLSFHRKHCQGSSTFVDLNNEALSANLTRSVAIILDVNPLEYCGGAERWILTLAKMLLKRGIEVHVYVPATHCFSAKIDFVPIIGIKTLYRLFTKTLAHPIPDRIMASTVKELANVYDIVILNNVAIVLAPYVRNAKSIGVIHDHFLVCPLRDVQCLDKDYGVEIKNCIKCLCSMQGLKHVDLYILQKYLAKCIESLDLVVLQSLSQLYNISLLSCKKIQVQSTVIGPIIDVSTIQKIKHGFRCTKKLLSLMHIGGIKSSRGFDRFVALSELLIKANRLAINEIHIHGRFEEMKMYKYFKELLRTAMTKKVKVHVGYIEYEKMLKELLNYASIVVSASRCTETAPLYVFETFALGSLVLALRKPYGPYEYSLRILYRVSEELAELYREAAAKLYEFFVYGDSSRLIECIAKLVDMYFNETMYRRASDVAVNIVEQNIDKAIELVLE